MTDTETDTATLPGFAADDENNDDLVPTLCGAPVDDESKYVRIRELKLRVCKKNQIREMHFVYVPKPGAPPIANVKSKCKCSSKFDVLRCALTVAAGIADTIDKGFVEPKDATKIRLNGKIITPKDLFARLNKNAP